MIGVDAIINTIHRETERYRDAITEEKSKIKNAFMAIKMVLNTSIIKIELCKERGYYKPTKLQYCIPDIALDINQTAIATKEELGIEIYNGLIKIAEYLVEFNEKINSLSLGVPIRDDVVELLKGLNELKGKIEEVEKL
ncbi:MAG: hypothetical protein ABIJ14_02355 [Nanoarchaeota archaeon]